MHNVLQIGHQMMIDVHGGREMSVRPIFNGFITAHSTDIPSRPSTMPMPVMYKFLIVARSCVHRSAYFNWYNRRLVRPNIYRFGSRPKMLYTNLSKRRVLFVVAECVDVELVLKLLDSLLFRFRKDEGSNGSNSSKGYS